MDAAQDATTARRPLGLAAIAQDPLLLEDRVSRDVHPDDGMMLPRVPGRSRQYFACGREAVGRICGLLATSGLPEPEAVLDYACGHGRVARYLRAAFPDARLYASDLLPGGMEHCARAFGAIPVPPDMDFDALTPPEPVALVWSGSLLTHLPQDRAAALLRFFARALRPGGLAVFTSHGRRVVEFQQAGQSPYGLSAEHMQRLADGFAKNKYAFISQVADGSYGISATPLHWFARQVAELPAMRIAGLVERGWDDHQDVVALLRTA